MGEKKMISHTGSCICGEIKFTVNLDEKPRIFSCHCIDCRKKIGGIVSIIQLREDALKVDESKLLKYSHNGGSEKMITKFFCKVCAAPLITYVEKWKVSYLYAGLLDDISILKKVNNIWYKDSHFPFMEVTENKIKT